MVVTISTFKIIYFTRLYSKLLVIKGGNYKAKNLCSFMTFNNVFCTTIK